MSQQLLEISVTDGINRNQDNSIFSTVFKDPIYCSQGSSIDFNGGFIDLGLTANDLIYIPNDILLGINFYEYEYDISKVPTKTGTDADLHAKRTMYIPANQANIIQFPESAGTPKFPNQPTQYGYKTSDYENSNLLAFHLKRQAPPTITTGKIVENFAPEERSCEIIIKSGFYSKSKFASLVNDQINQITGSFTNTDKPLVNLNSPTKPYENNTILPYDYQLTPNSTNPLLRAYEFKYTNASAEADDPARIGNGPVKIYIYDRTWAYWWFPVWTDPPAGEDLDEAFYPYNWFNPSQSGYMAGTSKFVLSYDAENNYFYIEYAHTPILDNKQQEVVQFTNSKQGYYDFNGTGGFTRGNIGYKSNGQMGGILISRLYSYDLDNTGNPVSTTNTGFWETALGFSGFGDTDRENMNTTMISKTITMYNNGLGSVNGGLNVEYEFNISYPNPKYMETNTTASLVPLQWLVQSNYTDPANDKGMSIYSADIPKVFQSVGTRPIIGDNRAFSKETGYYLVEINISGLKNDNYRSRDSYYQIMGVVGRTYSSGVSYLQGFADNTVQALQLTEDCYIDRVDIKILNPDKTPAIGLGQDSSIFLKIVSPVIVEKR